MSRRVVLYVRVSTEEQKRSGAGLIAQEQQLRERADLEGWTVVSVQRDEGISGTKRWRDRPGLFKAVQMVQAKEADALVVAKADRLARRAPDSLSIARDELVQKRGGRPRLICLDPDLDLTTPDGRFLFTIYAGMAESEADRISERTRQGLAVKRAQGVRLGRPGEYDDEVLRRIATLRLSGMTLQQIAETADAENLRTPRGGQWRQTGIHYLLKTQDGQKMMAELRADRQVIDDAVDNFRTTDKGLLDRLADS